MTLFDETEKEIGSKDNITFTADDPVLTLTDDTRIPAIIYCNEATDYIFGIHNAGFRFDSTLRFAILLEGEQKFISDPEVLSLARNESGIVSFNESINIACGENYTVRLLDGEKTVGELNGIKIKGFVGIDEVSSEQIRFSITDNAINLINVTSAEVAIYAADGRLVKSARNLSKIDIANLSNGAYMLVVKTNDNVKTLKFIK